jgi:hypothetical protein
METEKRSWKEGDDPALRPPAGDRITKDDIENWASLNYKRSMRGLPLLPDKSKAKRPHER